jgi:hypothetical protein
MLNRIPLQFAINTMLIILLLVISFHLLVLIQVIPYNIVWGGKFQNATQMRRFEIASIALNGLIIFIIAMRGQYIKLNFPLNTINLFLWLIVLLFSINIIGNLFAETKMEKIVFTPIATISMILCYRIVKGVRK